MEGNGARQEKDMHCERVAGDVVTSATANCGLTNQAISVIAIRGSIGYVAIS